MRIKHYFADGDNISKSEDFPIISSSGSEYCVYSYKYGILGTGKSITDAYEEYKNKLSVQEELLENFGLSSRYSMNKPNAKSYEVINNLVSFFLKSIIASFAVVLVVILLLPHAGSSFRHQITSLLPNEIKSGKYWAIDVPSNINSKLDALSKEEQEKIVYEWRKIISRYNDLLQNTGCH